MAYHEGADKSFSDITLNSIKINKFEEISKTLDALTMVSPSNNRILEVSTEEFRELGTPKRPNIIFCHKGFKR